ncbi:hypothetical protein KDA_71640 [Dictyobacter alpinus]|uniref:HAMP domain-containing protein n=1 Tax=Dictyobacter alpinus TaxID=2014873 RepID=A0A402BK24_9CHLR|nr:hypothetical protein [Dictyobacter alpinus]GCE31680.1 hypothetical protein KDA_71640 [Dictyobacter alpinus]
MNNYVPPPSRNAGLDTKRLVNTDQIHVVNDPLWKRARSLWYRYTAPPYPGLQATFKQQEAFRRGRLASLTLLFIIFLVVLFMAAMGVTTNLNVPVFITSAIVVFVLIFVMAWLIRHSHITAATLIMLLVMDGGNITTALAAKGGIGLINLPLFDIMIASELIAVSLLNPATVFLVCLFNCIFITLDIVFGPRAADLNHYLAMSGWAVVISRPLLLELAVAVVTWQWVTSANKALKRANKAEKLAAMEHEIAEYERNDAVKKRQLEQSIQYIIETQRQVANGDFTARVPTTPDNMLWPVAISFNNLLTRFQRYQREASEIERIRKDMPMVLQAIREAKMTGRPLQMRRTGTVIDAILLELNK